MSLVYGGAQSDDFQFVEGDELYIREGCYALWYPAWDTRGIRIREQLGYTPPGSLSTDWLTQNIITGTDALGTTDGWSNWNNSTRSSSTDFAYEGSRSLKAVMSGLVVGEGCLVGNTYTIPAASGQIWEHISHIKAPVAATLRVLINGRDSAGNTTENLETAFVGTGDWQEVTVTGTLANAATSKIYIALLTTVAAQGISVYWDGLSLRRTDMTGNAHAAITGAVWASGPNGAVLRFDAVDDYAKVMGDVIGVGARTIEALIKPTAGALTTPHILSNQECRLWVDWVAGANRIGFGRASATSIYSANGSIASGAWHHVMAASNAAGATSLYINGVLSGAASQAGGTPAKGADTHIGNLAALSKPLGGDIARLVLYNKALTAAEARELFYETGQMVGLG